MNSLNFLIVVHEMVHDWLQSSNKLETFKRLQFVCLEVKTYKR